MWSRQFDIAARPILGKRTLNLSSVSVLSLFLGSVLILIIVENTLSTSAVDTGIVRAIHANCWVEFCKR